MMNRRLASLIHRIVQTARGTWGSPNSLGFTALVLVTGVLVVGAQGSAQASNIGSEPEEMLRGAIKAAEQGNHSSVEVGGLWLRLAVQYQKRLDLPAAEDAFTHSLRLLRTPESQSDYAEALGGLGSIYSQTGRLADAENCLRKAVVISQGTANRLYTARLRVTLAINLLSQQHFREAEAESAKGTQELKSLPDAAATEVVAAYLTHSSALCHLGQCIAALADVDRATELAKTDLPEASVDMAGIWLIRGYDEWESGSLQAAERSTLEALKMLRSLTGLARPTLMMAELNVLRQYNGILKAAHRKPEAKQIAAQIAQLESEQKQVCGNCTVNAAALSAANLPAGS